MGFGFFQANTSSVHLKKSHSLHKHSSECDFFKWTEEVCTIMEVGSLVTMVTALKARLPKPADRQLFQFIVAVHNRENKSFGDRSSIIKIYIIMT